MRPNSLITRREVIIAALGLVLLGLTGSAGGAPAEVLPQIPPVPAAPASGSSTPVPSSPTPATSPTPTGAPTRPPAVRQAPRVPIVDASPRRPARPDPKGQPVHLRSADLDLDLPIRPVGVTKNGDMELPDTVTEVGWYRFGPYPSATRGTAVLAAHVDTRSEGLGPFVRLRDARPGDVVTVRDKGGRDRDFRIADVVSLSKQRIEWDQVFDRRGATRLVLITCGGPYDQRSGYRDNVLATAFPTT